MSFIYRCSKCRTRNTFKQAVVNYKPMRGLPKLTGNALKKELKANGSKQCRHCGHYHFYVDKDRIQRPVCVCGGMHFAHRPASSMCEQSPKADLLRAMRDGATDAQIEDLRMELALAAKTVSKVCPF